MMTGLRPFVNSRYYLSTTKILGLTPLILLLHYYYEDDGIIAQKICGITLFAWFLYDEILCGSKE
jgi:hypothetical protein